LASGDRGVLLFFGTLSIRIEYVIGLMEDLS